MKHPNPVWAIILALLLFSGRAYAAPSRGLADDAAALTQQIERLGTQLALKHGVTEHGDYGWLDSTDYNQVAIAWFDYEDFLAAHGLAAVERVPNAWELQRMYNWVCAAMEEISTLRDAAADAARRIQAGVENYRASDERSAQELRVRVNRLPASEPARREISDTLAIPEERLAATRQALDTIRRELDATNPETLRFDKTEQAQSLLKWYHICSADARAVIGRVQRAEELALRLAVLQNLQMEYEALLKEIPREVAEGAYISYAKRTKIEELEARYAKLETDARNQLDAALGVVRLSFLAARTKIAERAAAVMVVRSQMEMLPDFETIVQMSEDETTACAARVEAAWAGYGALLEEAERSELAALLPRLERARIATTRFSVSAAASEYGALEVESPVYYGKECFIKVLPKTGWQVSQIMAGQSTPRKEDGGWVFPVVGNVSVTARFEKLRYPISITAHCKEDCPPDVEYRVNPEIEHGAALSAWLQVGPAHVLEEFTATVSGVPGQLEQKELELGAVQGTLSAVTGPVAISATLAPRLLTVKTQCLLGGAPAACGSITAGAEVRYNGVFAGEVRTAAGYELQSLVANGKELTVLDGRFTVSDIREDVLITASFARASNSGAGTGGSGGGSGSGKGETGRPLVQLEEPRFLIQLTPEQEELLPEMMVQPAGTTTINKNGQTKNPIPPQETSSPQEENAKHGESGTIEPEHTSLEERGEGNKKKPDGLMFGGLVILATFAGMALYKRRQVQS